MSFPIFILSPFMGLWSCQKAPYITSPFCNLLNYFGSQSWSFGCHFRNSWQRLSAEYACVVFVPIGLRTNSICSQICMGKPFWSFSTAGMQSVNSYNHSIPHSRHTEMEYTWYRSVNTCNASYVLVRFSCMIFVISKTWVQAKIMFSQSVCCSLNGRMGCNSQYALVV